VPLVGFHAELVRLTRILEQAYLGKPCLVLVNRSEGIGKTALVRRFIDTAGDLCVPYASGDKSETSLAFGVFDQFVRQAPNPRSGLLAAGSHHHERQVDPLAAGAAVIDLLGELQDAGPVVLIVDDAHWADHLSLLALTCALRRLRVDRVLAMMLKREMTDRRLPDGLRRLLADDRTLRLSLVGRTSRGASANWPHAAEPARAS
jgi:predicted ATPase